MSVNLLLDINKLLFLHFVLSEHTRIFQTELLQVVKFRLNLIYKFSIQNRLDILSLIIQTSSPLALTSINT